MVRKGSICMDLGFAEEAEGSTARTNMEKLLCDGGAAQLSGKSLVLCFSETLFLPTQY